MESEENKTEWIDQYLDDALKEQERTEFERRLQSDPAFRLEVEAQKAVRRSLQDWGNAELKAKFKQFHARMQQQEDSSTPFDTEDHMQGKTRQLWGRPGVWAIAASFSLLLLAGIVWINRDTFFNPQKQEITAFQTFQIPVVAKGSDNMGYAGENTILDSIMVQIIQDHQYAFHYRFKDTLQIFSSAISPDDKLMLEHHEQTDTYTLVVDEKRYLVERGFNRIQELKEE